MSNISGNLPGGNNRFREKGRIIEPAFSYEQLNPYLKKAGIALASLITLSSIALLWLQ